MMPKRNLFSRWMRSSWQGPALLAALMILSLACGSRGGRPEKPARSALWVASGASLEYAEVARLEPVGVGELFVEIGRLRFSGSQPTVEVLPTFSLPRRTGVTLVISGAWPAELVGAAAVGEALAAELRRLGETARERGLEPLGFHLDIAGPTLPPSLVEGVAGLRDQLDPSTYLSVSLDRRWLAAKEARQLAKAADFVVPFLYGQRQGEREDSSAWDLRKVEQNLRTLDDWGEPYLIGVVTLARALHLSRQGEVLGETTRFDLPALVRNRGLELAHGFTLDAIDRQAYRFSASGPLKVGPFALTKGQGVYVLGLSSFHVEEFLRVTGTVNLEHHLGQLYYRVASPEEKMSLSITNLESALGPEPAAARPVLRLLGGGSQYQVELTNATAERSDVMVLGGNYVELTVEGGSFGSVDAGDFHRWELLEKKGGELVRAFRGAKILRLHAPLLEASETLKSGTIRVSGGKVRATGSFVVPGGTVVAAELVGAVP